MQRTDIFEENKRLKQELEYEREKRKEVNNPQSEIGGISLRCEAA